MTANELADELTKMFRGEEYDRLIHEIPDLLRQQAVEIIDLECEKERQREKFEEMLCDRDVEIEALKKELALQRLSDIGQEIENEPVAWMTENGTIFDELPLISGGLIPLYTHANEDRDSAIYATGYWNGIAKVKPRELTDEEISGFIHQMVLCCQVHPNSADINVLGLSQIVEDILKKASEK
jgi:hypothetical protein